MRQTKRKEQRKGKHGVEQTLRNGKIRGQANCQKECKAKASTGKTKGEGNCKKDTEGRTKNGKTREANREE